MVVLLSLNLPVLIEMFLYILSDRSKIHRSFNDVVIIGNKLSIHRIMKWPRLYEKKTKYACLTRSLIT